VQALGWPAGQALTLAVNAAFLVALVASAMAPFLRFRRAAYRQRQQLKWVAFTAAVGVLGVLAAIGLRRAGLPTLEPVLGILGFAAVVVGIPVAVGVTVLRHRLYDIDRLINRTVVYGLLTALLGLGYAGVVLLLGQLFGGVTDKPPSWAVAGATLVVARCSSPPAAASNTRWTGVSTGAATTPPRPSGRSARGAATTPPRPSGRSARGCASSSTWTPSQRSC
jgi:hypothetical protein